MLNTSQHIMFSAYIMQTICDLLWSALDIW